MLQQVDSKIDRIRMLRGELPLEVQDLEDEIEGLETRIDNLKQEIKSLESEVSAKKQEIKDANTLIKKYQELCEKRIKEFTQQVKDKTLVIEQSQKLLEERKLDLKGKRMELDNIINETQKEEEELIRKSEEYGKIIEPRLYTAYRRIRGNARNGLAVVTVQRDACGGCFNKIPPQRQLDIKIHKKIIVCEYCGRILVDDSLASM
jgi:predicted  nucleic acid-binding Zn-ribbon protein